MQSAAAVNHQLWTYFVEDSHSSLDTNTTEVSSDESNGALAVKSPANLDHTYYSIDAGHIYHTLDPANVPQNVPHNVPHPNLLQGTPVGNGRLYINRNLDLVDDGKGGVCFTGDGGRPPTAKQLFQITPPPSFSVNGSGQVKRLAAKMDDSEYVV